MESQNSKNSEARLLQPVRIREQIWPNDVLPLLSICCFTYNHKEFIKEAIEGFLMQETTFPVEINRWNISNCKKLCGKIPAKHQTYFTF